MEFLSTGRKKQSSRSKTYEIWNYLDFLFWMNSNSKTSCADSNLRPQCEASGTSKDLPRLRPRDEAKTRKSAEWGGGIGGDRKATLAHFGSYVNDVCNVSIKMCGKKRV
ncbi:hypothetical protein AVEN_262156-1 [Araneus ventricosus]|uniref:Uncharacterized protein n=1 Tax=Araneus ventricosus TaxID=182803 RepID=A0A4Y2EK63_ARAVE|nr:hypothetical protein AVEN_262156-1 [Araneus ventricosus]